MPDRIYVTGLGIISGIGNNLQENLHSLLQSKSGLGRLKYLESSLQNEILVSEVKAGTRELFSMANIPFAEGYSRNTLLGMIAASEAFQDAYPDGNEGYRTGLISGTTVGGMDECEKYYQDFLTNDSKNLYIDIYDCADSTEKIADHLNIRDFITTLSTACSSAANAILLGARMIRHGKLDRVIAGGTESLTRFHLNGFNALKILDGDPCKPFDANRKGINLGEGAAYIVLESERTLSVSSKKIYAELTGWGNACEAFHQTASSPDGAGAFLAMEKALNMSGLNPSEIDYINAHGTGTDNNDIAEGRAIERLFKSDLPKISSTKPLTGHTTSAAGSMEAILSILCLQQQVIWPNLNFKEKMQELSFNPVTSLLKEIPVKAVMTNSFGFGGNDTSLIFRKT